MEDLINKFNTYEKCMKFRNKLIDDHQDWETYWKDAGGRIIRESENDDSIGTQDKLIKLQKY